jgi:RsiW-degrading membrane proteinase PrsW (M82 family)
VGLAGGILVGFVPAIAWLWFFWRKDEGKREPKRLMLRVFGIGALMAGPIFLLEGHLPLPPTVFGEFFIRVALVEEFCKILPVIWLALRCREFDQPVDGVIYAVAAALGFAGAENAIYAIQAGGTLGIARAFTSTLLHVGLSGMVGYAIGKARFGRRYDSVVALAAFIAAVSIHGGYNLFIAIGSLPTAPEWIARSAVAFLLPAMMVLLSQALRRANAQEIAAAPTDR